MNNAEKAAAVVAITQLFKYYGASSKFCPLVAIGVAVLLEYSENPTSEGVLQGVILGATVTGGYGVVKNSAQTVIYKGNSSSNSSESSFSTPKTINIFELEHDQDRFS